MKPILKKTELVMGTGTEHARLTLNYILRKTLLDAECLSGSCRVEDLCSYIGIKKNHAPNTARYLEEILSFKISKENLLALPRSKSWSGINIFAELHLIGGSVSWEYTKNGHSLVTEGKITYKNREVVVPYVTIDPDVSFVGTPKSMGHAGKLYEMASWYLFKKSRENFSLWFSIDDGNNIFRQSSGPLKYKRWSALWQNVLKDAVAMVNAHVLIPFSISVETQKTGRAITHFRLKITRKKGSLSSASEGDVKNSKDPLKLRYNDLFFGLKVSRKLRDKWLVEARRYDKADDLIAKISDRLRFYTDKSVTEKTMLLTKIVKEEIATWQKQAMLGNQEEEKEPTVIVKGELGSHKDLTLDDYDLVKECMQKNLNSEGCQASSAHQEIMCLLPTFLCHYCTAQHKLKEQSYQDNAYRNNKVKIAKEASRLAGLLDIS